MDYMRPCLKITKRYICSKKQASGKESLNDSVTTGFRIHLRVTFCIIFIFLNNPTHLELLVISCLPLAWCLVPMWLHSHGEREYARLDFHE